MSNCMIILFFRKQMANDILFTSVECIPFIRQCLFLGAYGRTRNSDVR